MKFSYEWLKELAGIRESPQELGEVLTMRAFEVESVEEKGNDAVVDIKITANRVADASGHRGMAREIAAIKGKRIKSAKLRITEDKKWKTTDFLKIKIEDFDDCPRYTARMMAGVKVGESPQWLRERLETCGLQSISNVVDAANYVMLETGQPLHVFDCEKIKGAEAKSEKFKSVKSLIVRRAKEGEKILGLDDKEYGLDPEILVIADEARPLAIAGIKGGKNSGVGRETHTIIIESANFDPARVRIASKMLGLRTDASLRFTHGLDRNQTEEAADRLAQLIRQVAGGTIFAERADAYKSLHKPRIVPFRVPYANKTIGENLSPAFYKKTFSALGLKVQEKNKTQFIIEAPTRRPDIRLEEDLIEEAGRLFGYEKIRPRHPAFAGVPQPPSDELFWENRVRDLLIGMGFAESILYEFTGEKELDAFRVRKERLIELENPTSPDTRYLVPRLMIKYVASAAENLRNVDAAGIFGIGKSFKEDPNGAIEEKKDLVIALTKKGASGEEEFYRLKGAIDQMLEAMGISDHWYDNAADRASTEYDAFHPYRFAEIKIEDEKIGTVGETHPTILKNIKARARIAAAEIDFEKLRKFAQNETEFRPIGKYPAVIRDLAVVVPSDTRADDILDVIEPLGGTLLADTDLFDYFQDEEMEAEGQKSIAFHLIFQAPDRTLTDQEINEIVEKITRGLEEKNWEMR